MNSNNYLQKLSSFITSCFWIKSYIHNWKGPITFMKIIIHRVFFKKNYWYEFGSNGSSSCFTCTLDGKPFELDTTITNGCCWNLCSDCSVSSSLSLSSSFSAPCTPICFVSGALITEVITVPDGWATTCELLGEKVTTGVVAVKEGDEAMLTVPLQIVCTLLVRTCWTCAGLNTIEEEGETGFWDCSMTFSLRTVMGCEVGMACKINFWGVADEAGSVLAITVVRGTVWSVTVCSCWFPGETTTGTWVGVCKVLLGSEKITGSEHFHAESLKIIIDSLLKNYVASRTSIWRLQKGKQSLC